MAIHGALWVGGGILSPELQKKVSNNYSQLGVTYLQSGSKYEPNLSMISVSSKSRSMPMRTRRS